MKTLVITRKGEFVDVVDSISKLRDWARMIVQNYSRSDIKISIDVSNQIILLHADGIHLEYNFSEHEIFN